MGFMCVGVGVFICVCVYILLSCACFRSTNKHPDYSTCVPGNFLETATNGMGNCYLPSCDYLEASYPPPYSFPSFDSINDPRILLQETVLPQ